MCDGLRELREALEAFAGRFDADLITAAAATLVVQDAAAVENMAAAIKAAAAAREAGTGLWRRGGDPSPAHALARKSGSSVGQAAEALATARRLRALPATDAAARRGELSPAQASAIADAASADPGAEAQLLDKARDSSLGELREEVARAKAAALPDAEARRRRIHEQRYLRTWNDRQGAWNLAMRDNPEVGAEIMAALAPLRDRLAAEARAAGRHERLEAHAADALAEMARNPRRRRPERRYRSRRRRERLRGPWPLGRRGPSRPRRSCRPPGPRHLRRRSGEAKILVRIDLDALLRGYAVGGETVELVGYGPVAVSAVRDMIDSADPFLAAIATRGVDVVGVAHLGRRPNAHQRSALEWLCPTCTVQGCSARWHLEVDHRIDWADTHFTLLDLLDRLCGHHHRLKTVKGWALVQGVGKRPMVPPDDPRHPRHAHPGQSPPAVAV